jgi:hypothetical protein
MIKPKEIIMRRIFEEIASIFFFLFYSISQLGVGVMMKI